MVPFFAAQDVEAAVSPERALEAVREAFVAYARGEWSMPPKVYVPAYPAGDFRAMPALGAGHAVLKWVTSFPGNPARGLPTVMGSCLLSDASNGMLEAVLDAGAVTALAHRGGGGARGGDARARGRRKRGGHRRRRQRPRGRADLPRARARRADLGRRSEARGEAAAAELGARVAGSREEALAADLLVTMTPGHEVAARGGLAAPRPARQPDGRRRARARPRSRSRSWRGRASSATTGSRPATTASSHTPSRPVRSRANDVTELGAVLAGGPRGVVRDDEITVFDSTGLAIQDLAIALAALERAGELEPSDARRVARSLHSHRNTT